LTTAKAETHPETVSEENPGEEYYFRLERKL
jgi:hypothetical protein